MAACIIGVGSELLADDDTGQASSRQDTAQLDISLIEHWIQELGIMDGG